MVPLPSGNSIHGIKLKFSKWLDVDDLKMSPTFTTINILHNIDVADGWRPNVLMTMSGWWLPIQDVGAISVQTDQLCENKF